MPELLGFLSQKKAPNIWSFLSVLSLRLYSVAGSKGYFGKYKLENVENNFNEKIPRYNNIYPVLLFYFI